ncbi:diguanylate cyclase domain-containing protein [Metabacillus sp. FJAT-53654]|uniref:Diguanylate cyclase n=1 Tax=Metabacillus rhizosphaerae TaxID=3117747 RepID=A0ABZ2MZG8_9BACI
MGDQLVVLAIKSTFFEFLSNNHRQPSINEILKKLTSVLKRELCIKDAIFYSYNKQLDYLTPAFKDRGYPVKAVPDDLQYGKLYFFEEQAFIPIIQNDTLHGLVELKGLNISKFSSASLDEVVKSCSSFFAHSLNLVQITLNEQKFKQLYRLTEKFHSFMNKDDVLSELVTTLQSMFFEYNFYLFLSHDHENHLDLPIKDLGFDHQDGNEMAMEAFVTGNAQRSFDKKNRQMIVYIPLKGKQGVYGVLQVVANHGLQIEDENVNFVAMLANAAGTALENAQLYEQSKRLIKDLQLINETSHRLNKNLRLTDTMTYMSLRILNSFKADEVGFFYINQNGSIQIFPGSTNFFNTEEVMIYIQYVREKIEKDLEGLFIGDITTYLKDLPYSSVMAVPMVQSENLKGCALVLHKDPYHFSFDMFKLLQSLIHHSTLALTNSLLREELETLVKTDHLTQLFSRNYFNDFIGSSMQKDRQGTFVLIDIDNFKKVNDTYGHQVGDEVLVQVANIIKSNIRENDVGARWGGEELAVYLPQVDLASGISVAERIVKRVRENTNPMITISCGVSYWNAEIDKNFHQLFSKADKALYIAKNEGKNQVIVQV